MIMINQKKVYLGAIRGEKIAALFYDYIAIMSQGVGAKTNFNYTANDLGRILEIFQKKEDKANYNVTGLSTQSITSSALPGIENVENCISKRRCISHGSDEEVQQSNDAKEDMLLASQVFSKEANPSDQIKPTSESTGNHSLLVEASKDGFLQRLLTMQNSAGRNGVPANAPNRGPQADTP